MAEEKENVEEKKGGKNLLFILPAVLLLLAGVGGGVYVFMFAKPGKEKEDKPSIFQVGVIFEKFCYGS